MFGLRDWSLKTKLICAGLLALLLTLAAQTIIYTARVTDYMRADLDARARQLRPILTAALAAPLAQRDYATVQQILIEVQHRDGLAYLLVLSRTGSVVAAAGWREGEPMPVAHSGVPSSSIDGALRFDYAHPITYAGQTLGDLRYGVSAEGLGAATSELFGIGVRVAVAAAIAFALMLIALGVLLTRPLERLTRASQSIRAGHYDIELPRGGRDEVGVLAENFGHMAAEVKERIRALTEREAQLAQAKEQAEAASNAKSQFLAKVSHEVRTPLNGVLGLLQTLETSALSGEQREHIRIAYESGQSLLAVLNGILDFSRVEAGEMTLQRAPFDVRREIETVVALFRELAHDKGLALEATLELGALRHARGDATRLRQILSNLIANAIKFTDRGAVSVRASTAPSASDQVLLVVAITDTGIGIDPAQCERIFEPFVQGDDSITRRFGGTGLGLTIARQLARALGGELTVASTLGQGATFTLTMPLDPIAAGDIAKVAEAPPRRQFGLHLLLVEDNAVNLRILERMVRMLGCTSAVARDGAQALELLAARPFDLVLMDLQMPVMDGLEAMRQLRVREHAQHLPRAAAIAVTAHALDEERTRALEGGFDDFVSKPIDLTALESAIARVSESADRASVREDLREKQLRPL